MTQVVFNALTGKFDQVRRPTTIEIPYYQYIYNSSGAQEGNRFNNFFDMTDAINGRECRVQFEQNETMPEGAINIDYHNWLGNGQNPDGGGLVITFETGTTISSGVNWQCQNGLNIHSTSDDPIYTMAVPHVLAFDRTAIYTDNAEFFRVECSGLIAVLCSNGFGLYSGQDGGPGSYEVFNIVSDPYTTVLVITEGGISPNIQNNTIRSTVPFIYGWLKQSSETSKDFATQANINPGSINFNGDPLGFGGSYFSNAEVVAFPEGKPIGINSETVTLALTELATHDVDVPSSATDTGIEGQIAYDSDYIYCCIATNTWKRTPISSW